MLKVPKTFGPPDHLGPRSHVIMVAQGGPSFEAPLDRLIFSKL
jgi:hypothetical protein